MGRFSSALASRSLGTICQLCFRLKQAFYFLRWTNYFHLKNRLLT
jgi:hypothetical protein